MAANDELLALADELEGVSLKDDCESCLASGTSLCRGDLECAESAHKACAKRLREIVEHDAGEVTTVSAYDLLPEDEREAIAWVREYGGLDAVEKRLMPAGMEWPRFEDGEPVRLGEHWEEDGFDESVTRIDGIEFADDGVRFENEYSEVFCRYGERVKRPAPKVLDADGVEIHVGDTVYHVKDGSEMTVYGIEGEWLVVSVGGRVRHDIVTHRAPVLAADGKPLEAGQTVYAKNYGYVKCTVLAIEWVVDGYLVEVENEGGHKFRQTPDEFTHERPDSWERLEHDAEKTVCEYFGANYDCANCPLESARCAEEVKKDIIRRAKKLAEREQ